MNVLSSLFFSFPETCMYFPLFRLRQHACICARVSCCSNITMQPWDMYVETFKRMSNLNGVGMKCDSRLNSGFFQHLLRYMQML